MGMVGKLAGGIALVAVFMVSTAPPALAATGSQIDNVAIDQFFVADTVSVGPTTGLGDGSTALEFAGTWDASLPGTLFVSEITRDEETGKVIARSAPKHVEGGVNADELVTLENGAAVIAVIRSAKSSVVVRVTNVDPTDEYEFGLIIGEKVIPLVDTQLPTEPLRTATSY